MYQYIYFSTLPFLIFFLNTLIDDLSFGGNYAYFFFGIFVIPIFSDKKIKFKPLYNLLFLFLSIILLQVFSFQFTFILSSFLSFLLIIHFISFFRSLRLLLPVTVLIPVLALSYIEFKNQNSQELLGLQELFTPQKFSKKYLSLKQIKDISLKNKSILFPLSQNPLIYINGQIQYSDYWKNLYLNIVKEYPIFYIFKDGNTFWFYGNQSKSYISFFQNFQSKIISQEDNLLIKTKISNLLLHQVISFDGMLHDYQTLKRQVIKKAFFNPFKTVNKIRLHKYHENFPYLIYKELFSKEKTTFLFSKEVLQKSILKLIKNQDFLVADNLTYFYFTLYGPDDNYHLLTTLLSTVYISPQTSIALLFHQDPKKMNNALLFQSFRLLETQEKNFISYGKSYIYDPILICLKKLLKQNKNNYMYFQNKIIKYSRLDAIAPEYSGCGCSEPIKPEIHDK
ncbi:MAG: hypothetical protein COB02_11075 [Candidatus Cloacimonadota bacterium]|nr:MAG: hypothetical protein COB02_11075 [Candidatus Cloacimonadota bacterium]